MAKKIIIAYIPVLHQGYRQLLEANPEYHTLYILGNDVVDRYRPLQKDIRRLNPEHTRQALVVWNVLDEIKVASRETLEKLSSEDVEILMPDEDVCRDLASEYFQDKEVSFYPIFLRWDRAKSNAKDPVDPDASISADELDKTLITEAHSESRKSPDIWRRVGALIARDGRVISKTYNRPTPTGHSSWMYGDPRNNYSKGADIEKSTFIHAEAALIAEAAQKGTRLAGADMYVTTFPCSPCAMLIANAGIRRLFFTEGYAVLDGKNVLRSRKVELIKVDVALKPDDQNTLTTYPEDSNKVG